MYEKFVLVSVTVRKNPYTLILLSLARRSILKWEKTRTIIKEFWVLGELDSNLYLVTILSC